MRHTLVCYPAFIAPAGIFSLMPNGEDVDGLDRLFDRVHQLLRRHLCSCQNCLFSQQQAHGLPRTSKHSWSRRGGRSGQQTGNTVRRVQRRLSVNIRDDGAEAWRSGAGLSSNFTLQLVWFLHWRGWPGFKLQSSIYSLTVHLAVATKPIPQFFWFWFRIKVD